MAEPIVWDASEHTFVKHEILKRYLGAWFAKLGQTHRRVVFIDGFAGPGEYADDRPGSPIVALDTALNHSADLSRCELVFRFLERDKRRAAHLASLLASRSLPTNFNCEVINEAFEPAITSLLNAVDRQFRTLAPSFIMIDPFGWTGFPHALIRRLGRHKQSEVFVSFMFETMNRFLTHPDQVANLDRLFGTGDWRQAVPLAAEERRAFLLDLYRSQIQAAGYRYTYPFELRDDRNKPEYFLVHGTKSLDGLAEMKRAMWAADITGRFRFSDWEDARRRKQPVLIGEGFDSADLEARILRFAEGGRWIDVNNELREWVLVRTPYHDGHYKQRVLQPLEKKPGLIEVERPSGRRPNYWAEGTRFRLL